MQIGEVATRTGVTPETLRYYESIDLIPAPERLENGYRSYGADTLERVSFIREAQSSGLSLVEIQLILSLRAEGEPTCDHVTGMLRSHLRDLEDQIGDLERTADRIRHTIARAERMDPADCNDPIRCQTIAGTRGDRE